MQTQSDDNRGRLITSTQSARFNPLQYFLYAAHIAIDFDR